MNFPRSFLGRLVPGHHPSLRSRSVSPHSEGLGGLGSALEKKETNYDDRCCAVFDLQSSRLIHEFDRSAPS